MARTRSSSSQTRLVQPSGGEMMGTALVPAFSAQLLPTCATWEESGGLKPLFVFVSVKWG